MTQEDKELLLKDLSTRLPYKTYIKTTKGIGYVYAINTSQLVELSVANDSEYWSEVFNIDEIKPYLRSMSNMTGEEKKEYYKILVESQDCSFENSESATTMVNDWLLSKGFDVRGLIPKGLAIAITKENNPYED